MSELQQSDLEDYIPVGKNDRLMVLLNHLKFKRRKSVKEYAQLFNVSQKTIYRYLEQLEINYAIEKDFYGRYFILTEKDEDELNIKITAEEMSFLHQLVKNSKSKWKESLLKKLDPNLGLDLSESEFYAEKIDKLETAIGQKRRVVLQDYTSGSTATPKNKYLEPIAITDLKYLSAYDYKAEKNKLYHIERIQSVNIEEEPFHYEQHHQHIQPDVFGMFTGKAYHIILALSTRAYLLMQEEFPRSKAYLRKVGDAQYPYELDLHVYGLEGIGRFVMGLIDQIEIKKGEELKIYLKGRLKVIDKF